MRSLFVRRGAVLVPALYIVLHFLWFAFDGTRVSWTEDDPMNLYTYWKAGLGSVVLANLEFWNGFYRPLGGLFYLPIYAFAGMHAAPYRWAIFALLGLNAWQVYRLARGLGGSTRLAGFACLFACVHGGMADLVYSTSSVYDVLCVTFSLLTLILYVSGASRVAVLASMILAINAKEIAATLPAFFLLYELLFQPAKASRNAWFSFLALGFAAVAMYGKMHGADSMTANTEYRPIFTLARWLEANVAYTGLIFYRPFVSAPVAIGVWIAMALVAALTKSRMMMWALGFVLLVTIPISFIPRRLGGSLYLPLAGWAIWFGTFFDWLVALLPIRVMRGAASAAIAIGFTLWTAQGFAGQGDALRHFQGTTRSVLASLERFPYRPPHGKRILITGSPYHEVFDLVFLSNLFWNDRTLQIEDANMAPDHGADWSRFEIVIGFKGEDLQLLKQ